MHALLFTADHNTAVMWMAGKTVLQGYQVRFPAELRLDALVRWEQCCSQKGAVQ